MEVEVRREEGGVERGGDGRQKIKRKWKDEEEERRGRRNCLTLPHHTAPTSSAVLLPLSHGQIALRQLVA